MTKEEAIAFGEMWLDVNEDCKDSNTYDFFKISIEVLKQGPFINKPCVSSGVCEHDKNTVFDEIKAEIESMDFDFGDYYDHTNEIIEMVCKVIDKCKTESEE